jgi:outer membrane cobalamin receptor
LDTEQAGAINTVNSTQIAEAEPPQAGRRILDLVNDQPGWLYEQNGVLHPRESEYEVLFVVDGIPLTDNQSPAFSPGIASNDVDSMQIRTSGFPAEYGRSLGGVVDVTTRRQADSGWHGDFAAQGGSFTTRGAEGHLGYGTARTQTTVSAEGFASDRYLDPPVLPNFTNNGTHENVQAEESWSPRGADTLHFSFLQGQVRNNVPNDLAQQTAGQVQNNYEGQQGATASWTHAPSSSVLFESHASLRETTAQLTSNAASTPLIVNQYRGLREGYLGTAATWHGSFFSGSQEIKAGADSILSHVHEQLNYMITDPTQFDPGTQPAFSFFDRHWDIEPGCYAQDSIHDRNWNLNAGLRYDVYRFVVHQTAFSPRVSISRYIPQAGLLVHASYDRVFQTPAVANLLLASSPQLDSVSSFVERLPVQPARADFTEFGASRVFAHVLRVDGSVFRRDFDNYADDDTLFSTGISFPIAEQFARIQGEEVSLQLQHWKKFSGYASYANQTGTARGPITGGLFLGDEGIQELATQGTFAVSQDQRNTLRMQLRYAAARRMWVTGAYIYNSGLPADLDPTDTAQTLIPLYGAALVEQLDFARGRVHPSHSVDAAAGATLLDRQGSKLELEIHGANLTDHLNVINFASLFSGTGIAPPRSVQARLRYVF